MILNHQHGFIFVHVPKAAGTTITRALSPLTTFRDLELGGTKYGEAIQELFASRFGLRKHSTGAVIRGKCPPHIWRRFFVFAFVRSPYARAYSVYRFLQRWKEGPHHAEVIDLDFTAFLQSPKLDCNEIEIARPQAHWLCKDGAVLPGIDFVGRVESFAEDFSFVLSVIHRTRTGWDEERQDNVSAAVGEWEQHMSPANVARIEALYAEDFAIWDFPRFAPVSGIPDRVASG
ncbi:MAG: sulfotransferase family 2 domain-containing protein [Pseudomonadota bacterium]